MSKVDKLVGTLSEQGLIIVAAKAMRSGSWDAVCDLITGEACSRRGPNYAAWIVRAAEAGYEGVM